MNSSLFMRLSAQVTVADLLNPLQAKVSADLTLAAAQAHIARHTLGDGRYALVVHGRDVVGWIDESPLDGDGGRSDDAEPEMRVEDVMRTFEPIRFLTADTPARRALTVVAQGDPFEPWFVLDGHEFVGTLDYDCFFKAPFRVCLFALATQLEQRSLWLCAQKAEAGWQALSEGRRGKASEVMKQRRMRQPPTGLGDDVDEVLWTDEGKLLGFTTFIDKKTIICKLRLLPAIPKSEIERVFDWMENLRNFCAHPDTYEEPFIAPHDLLEQIVACEKLMQAIEQQLLPPPPVES